jgi:hypothetical protein
METNNRPMVGGENGEVVGYAEELPEYDISEHECRYITRFLNDLDIPKSVNGDNLTLTGRVILMYWLERRKIDLLAKKLESAGWQYAQEPRKSCTDPDGWIKWVDSRVKGE